MLNKDPFFAPIAQQIWDMKYRFKHADGMPIDLTVQDSWARIAKALSQPEVYMTPAPGSGMLCENREKQQFWEAQFYSALEDFKYLPAGRITSGAGTGRAVTLFNCFVMGTIPDSMSGIFDMLKEAALTMQQGGGIGYDFSTIRPKNSPVKGVAADASGPLAFMDVWDAMCRTVMSAGSRRGAMMGTMRCDHPDIMEFIQAKQDSKRLRMFNLSVLATNDFMDAVEHNLSWDLVHAVAPANSEVEFVTRERADGKFIYKTVRARDIWEAMMEGTYGAAEPGVIFIDRINEENNLRGVETISATNPCVAYETPILTLEHGYTPIGEIVNQDVHVWNGECWSLTTPRVTGENQSMVSVTLSDGSHLRCTRAHKFVLSDGSKRDAEDLSKGDKLIKHTWPTIVEGVNPEIDPYSQGFFSGDGLVKVETGGHYIGLYGDKKNICHEWGEVSRKEYDINGGFEGTDTTQTKEYLYFGQDFFKPKEFVPSGSDLYYRKVWLAGLIDSDGHVTSDSCIQISSKNREFLTHVKLMLNTMGATGSVSEMKDHYRLSISGNFANELNLPSKRHTVKPVSFPKSRFVTVTDVVPSGVEKIVYCFTENILHRGVFNGVLTGQCGEQPLPPYGACLLGSINLSQFVNDPFEDLAYPCYEGIDRTAAIAVRAMDNVIDCSSFAIPQQKEEAIAKRRIGLGVTGLANALAMLRIRYGTEQGASAAADFMRCIDEAAYWASVELAKEKGPYPLFDADQVLAPGTHASTLPEDLQAAIREHGLRNALLTSIAPTGTISLYAGNVSSGIEPPFAYNYERKVLQKDGTQTTELVEDYAVARYRELWEQRNAELGADGPEFDPKHDLPDYFTNAQELTPMEHLRMQAALQKHVDSAISKTINMPEDISYEDFKQVYWEAWKQGCKGCTTYRPNDVTGSVLSVTEEKAPEYVKHSEGISAEEAELLQLDASDGLLVPPDWVNPNLGVEYVQDARYMKADASPIERPEALDGRSYAIKVGDQKTVYLNVNDLPRADGTRQPFEMFLVSADPTHTEWMSAIARSVSAVMRKGMDATFLAHDFQRIHSSTTAGFLNGGGGHKPSLIAAIGARLERHISESKVPAARGEETPSLGSMDWAEPPATAPEVLGGMCPKCHTPNLQMVEGCKTCTACFHSACG